MEEQKTDFFSHFCLCWRHPVFLYKKDCELNKDRGGLYRRRKSE